MPSAFHSYPFCLWIVAVFLPLCSCFVCLPTNFCLRHFGWISYSVVTFSFFLFFLLKFVHFSNGPIVCFGVTCNGLTIYRFFFSLLISNLICHQRTLMRADLYYWIFFSIHNTMRLKEEKKKWTTTILFIFFHLNLCRILSN